MWHILYVIYMAINGKINGNKLKQYNRNII